MRVLLIGAGIGGLSAAIALTRKGNTVTAIERDPNWTPAKTPRFEVSPVIQSGDWTESFDAPTQPVFAGGAPGAAEQGR